MNKFQSFLGRNSAETCLKMDYFGSKSQKSPSARPLTSGGWLGTFTHAPVELQWLKNVQDPTSIEQFRMLQKPLLPLQKRSCATVMFVGSVYSLRHSGA